MKYPYIAKGLNSGSIVLFYEQNKGITLELKTWASENLQHSNCINEDLFKNITAEYLANTYGKVESKEHADFIVNLAESAGFKVGSIECQDRWFCFAENHLYFYPTELRASDAKEKPTTIPLPPKEKSMKSQKEWPQVGDDVLYDGSSDRFESIKGEVSKVIAKYSFEGSDYITIKHHNEGVFAMVVGSWLRKPQTPEEELNKSILKFLEGGKTYDRLAKAIINGEIKGLSYKPE